MDDVKYIRASYQAGVSVDEMATKLNRSPDAVRDKITEVVASPTQIDLERMLQYPTGPWRENLLWCPIEYEYILLHYPYKASIETMAKTLNRPVESVRAKIEVLTTKRSKEMTSNEIQTLKRAVQEGDTTEMIAVALQRTPKSIKRHIGQDDDLLRQHKQTKRNSRDEENWGSFEDTYVFNAYNESKCKSIAEQLRRSPELVLSRRNWLIDILQKQKSILLNMKKRQRPGSDAVDESAYKQQRPVSDMFDESAYKRQRPDSPITVLTDSSDSDEDDIVDDDGGNLSFGQVNYVQEDADVSGSQILMTLGRSRNLVWT